MPTRLADVIVPEVFTEYVTNRTAEKSLLIQSGIIERNAEFDRLAGGEGRLIEMPFWNDLTGEEEIVDDHGEFTAGKITASSDQAIKHVRGRMWGVNQLTSLLAGSDPMQAIGNLVADYWNRRDQAKLLATLNGIFSAGNMSDKHYDISGNTADGAVLSGHNFIDATQVMGDAKELLTGVMMHSAVETHLRKLNLIESIRPSDGGEPINYFQGKRVIVDDAMPFNTEDLVGSMYLFGSGAIAKGIGSHPNIVATEVDRNAQSKAGEEFLINRHIDILHPRGVKWTDDSITGRFPTNEELQNGSNWNRVFEPKQIRIVKFTFRVEAEAVEDNGEEIDA